MKRIISTNPHRTEENQDQYDYMEGAFIVIWKNVHEWSEKFKYSGNNMSESFQNRKIALKRANEFAEAMMGARAKEAWITETVKDEKGEWSQQGKENYKTALKVCDAIMEASMYWSGEDESNNPKLKTARTLAGVCLDNERRKS